MLARAIPGQRASNRDYYENAVDSRRNRVGRRARLGDGRSG